jgi:hypothetical protein
VYDKKFAITAFIAANKFFRFIIPTGGHYGTRCHPKNHRRSDSPLAAECGRHRAYHGVHVHRHAVGQFIPALAFGVIAVKFYRRFLDNRPDGNTHVALGFSAYLRRIRDLEPFHPDHHSGLAGGVRDYLADCVVNISIIKFDDG